MTWIILNVQYSIIHFGEIGIILLDMDVVVCRQVVALAILRLNGIDSSNDIRDGLG
jgi:hypothetical protein